MTLLALVAVMAAAVAGGALAERRWGTRAERGSRRALTVMLTWALPPVYLVLASRIHPDLRLLSGIVTAYAAIAAVSVLAWWIADRWLRLPRPVVGAVVLATMLANTGYFGLPLTRVVLGPEQLGAAVAWDSLVSGPMFYLVAFAVGAAFAPAGLRAPGTSAPAERRIVGFLKNPLLWAAVIGLALPFDAPDWSAEIAYVLVYALLPVGFVVVGVQLMSERRAERAAAAAARPEGVRDLPGQSGQETKAFGGPARWRRIIAPEVALVVGLRLVVAPAIVLGASLLALDLPDAMLLQAAAPAGLNGLLVAHRFGLHLPTIASSIVWTTSLMTLAVVVVSVVG